MGRKIQRWKESARECVRVGVRVRVRVCVFVCVEAKEGDGCGTQLHDKQVTQDLSVGYKSQDCN